MDQALNVFISQLEIKDGDGKNIIISGEQDSKVEATSNETLRRSGRKRIRPPELVKKRVFSKPKRLHEQSNSKDIENYYLDKKIKRLPPSLETIYEEPSAQNIMSTRKFKRSINFPDMDYLSKSKLKVKKRLMKAKKVSSRPKKKMTMDMLLKKLAVIEENESEPLK